MTRIRWKSPPAKVGAPEGSIHVWAADLDDLMVLSCVHESDLAPEELERAARFRSEEDRTRFVVRRAVLRMILARYLYKEPASLRFRRGPHGKPALDTPDDGRTIRFNASASDGLAVYAVTVEGEVGVDIEAIRLPQDWLEVTEDAFAASEACTPTESPCTQPAGF